MWVITWRRKSAIELVLAAQYQVINTVAQKDGFANDGQHTT